MFRRLRFTICCVLDLHMLFLFCDFAVAAGITWLQNQLILTPFRRKKGQHWTERARVLWPARTAAAATVWLLPADLVLAQRLLFGSAPHWALASLAAWFGALAGTCPFDLEAFPWLTLRTWAHQVFAAWSLRFVTWPIFFGIIVLMPKEFTWRAWILGGVFLIAFALWAGGGLILCWRSLHLVSPAPDRLKQIAMEVSTSMGLRFRHIWLIKSSWASAFALPFTNDLLFSTRLLNRFPDNEVAAICAHELGHLGESKWTLTGRLTGVLFYVPCLFVKPVAWTWGAGGVLLLGLLSFSFLYTCRRLSRRLEQRADGIARNQESDPGVYARALARLHEENLIPAVLPRQRTHPDLYDRLVAAGVQPEYPRPEKPAPYSASLFALWALFVVLVMATLVRLG